MTKQTDNDHSCQDYLSKIKNKIAIQCSMINIHIKEKIISSICIVNNINHNLLVLDIFPIFMVLYQLL